MRYPARATPKSLVSPTIKEYALEAWAQERRRLSEHKKRKRKAKKIEDAIEEILSKDSLSYRTMRNLDPTDFGVVVSVLDGGEPLLFTFNDERLLVLTGKGSGEDKEILSPSIESTADLGRALEQFSMALEENDRRAEDSQNVHAEFTFASYRPGTMLS